MPRNPKAMRLIAAAGLTMAASGCMMQQTPRAVEQLPLAPTAQTKELAQLKDAMDGRTPMTAMLAGGPKTEQIVPLKGMGYAQVAGQPGKTTNEKRLMAIRAARLEAMRDLAEQIHGLHISSTSTVNDMVLRSDYIRGVVEGQIRGARTTAINPKSADTFEVVLTLDADVVRYIVRAAKKGL